MDESSQNPYDEGYSILRAWSLSWACVYMEPYWDHGQVSHQDQNPLVQAPFQDSVLTLRHLGAMCWKLKFICRHPCMNTGAFLYSCTFEMATSFQWFEKSYQIIPNCLPFIYFQILLL